MLLPKPFMNYALDPQLDSSLARQSGQDHLKVLSSHLTTILPISSANSEGASHLHFLSLSLT